MAKNINTHWHDINMLVALASTIPPKNKFTKVRIWRFAEALKIDFGCLCRYHETLDLDTHSNRRLHLRRSFGLIFGKYSQFGEASEWCDKRRRAEKVRLIFWKPAVFRSLLSLHFLFLCLCCLVLYYIPVRLTCSVVKYFMGAYTD